MPLLRRWRWAIPGAGAASFFLGFVIPAGLLAGCHQPAVPSSQKSAVVIEHQVFPQPPTVGPATVTLKLSEPSGKPIEGAKVSIEGNMTHPGMGPQSGQAREVAPGWYEAPMEFTMSGDWIIFVRLKLRDGQSMEQQFDVKGVRAS
jgi:hypothetical protein